MGLDGKDFNTIMKFCAIISLIAFAIWITKSPICLVALFFVKSIEDDE